MKNTQKKKISRSYYHLQMKVESGKCRRVTAAIDVIVTLCRKSVGKVYFGRSALSREDSFSLAASNFELFLFLRIFHLPFSFNCTFFYLGWSLSA